MIDLPFNAEDVARGFRSLDEEAKASVIRELRKMSPDRRAVQLSAALSLAKSDLESVLIRHVMTRPAQERVDAPENKMFNPPDAG